MAFNLTPGGCDELASGNTNAHPTVQIVLIKRMASQTAQGQQERYRFSLSDGARTQHAMLATQMNHMVADGTLNVNTVITLEEYLCNVVQNKRIIIVLKMRVEGNPGQLIGQPTDEDGKPVTPEGINMGGAPPQQQQMQQQNNNNGWGAPNGGGQPQKAGNQWGAPQQAPPPQQQQQGYGQPPAQQWGNSNNNHGGPPHGANQWGGNGNAVNGGGQQWGGAANGGGGPPQAGGPRFGGGAPGYNDGGRGGHSAVQRNDTAHIIPISQLNPYQNRWTIKGRVTSRGDIRTFHRASGPGRVTSCDLLDAHGGEIRVTMFNDAIDRHYETLKENAVVIVSKGQVKSAKRQFSNLDNDHEITLETSSIVEACNDDGSIKAVKINARPIASLSQCAKGDIVDVMGVLDSVDPMGTIIRRESGQEVQKQPVKIRDQSNAVVEVTMWGGFVQKYAQNLEAAYQQGRHPVIAVKGARVGDFNGITLGTLGSTSITIDPEVPETSSLRTWWDSGAATQAPPVNLSGGGGGLGGGSDRRVRLYQVKSEHMGSEGKAEWVETMATVQFVKQERICYPSHPETKKKLTRHDENSPWTDESTGNTVDKPVYRYLMSIQLIDHTGQQWVSCFDDAGVSLMGCSADEMMELQDTDENSYSGRINAVTFSHGLFKLKVANDDWQGEVRQKVVIQRYTKVDYAAEASKLADLIKRLKAGENIDERPPPKQSAQPATGAGGWGGGAAQGGGGQQRGGYGNQGNNHSGWGGGGGGGGGGWGNGNSNAGQQGGAWGGGGGGSGWGSNNHGGAPNQNGGGGWGGNHQPAPAWGGGGGGGGW